MPSATPSDIPATGLQLHSTVKAGGSLELSLVEVDIPELGENDVLVRMGVSLVHSSVREGSNPKSLVYNWLAKMGDEAASRSITLAIETHPNLLHNGDVCLETM